MSEVECLNTLLLFVDDLIKQEVFIIMIAFCVNCTLPMKVIANGVHVIVHSNLGPWKIFVGDRYSCAKCGKSIVADFGDPPVDNYGGNPEFTKALVRARHGEHYDLKD